jgi:hypothetical protein
MLWEFLKTLFASSGVILFVIILWSGTQEFARRYKKNHPNDTTECKKETSDCISCGSKDICSKK